jgi:hypothetical protein
MSGVIQLVRMVKEMTVRRECRPIAVRRIGRRSTVDGRADLGEMKIQN